MLPTIRLAAPLTFDSIVDGPGLRMVLWTQGCPHACKGCHNPETWDVDGGYEESIDTVIKAIQNSKLQVGLTISGGEPLQQVEALLPIMKATKQIGLNIWLYTGYTFEDIQADKTKSKILEYVDIVVDGTFIQSLKSYTLRFKGSSNQRVIDVKASLKQQQIIERELN